MQLIVTGSIAFDYLMSFPGRFTEHFLPEHMNRMSLSFLVDSMDKRRGGCAPNIAYTLALLGERPKLMATAGQDFGDYRQWMEGARDRYLAGEDDGREVLRLVLLQHRPAQQPDRLVLHRRHGQCRGAVVPRPPAVDSDALVIISPNDPDAMVQYAEECSTMGIKYIWDPGQQCARMGGDQLKDGIIGAFMVICNDYEFELIRQKTGFGEQDVLANVPLLVVTKGEHGCTVMTKDGVSGRARGTAGSDRGSRPASAMPSEGVHEGAGGGPADTPRAPKLGSVAATYALEHLGGTYHAYSWEEFKAGDTRRTSESSDGQALARRARRLYGLSSCNHILDKCHTDLILSLEPTPRAF